MSSQAPVVAFGPDVQVYALRTLLAKSPPFDIRALAAHELFHAQHYARNPQMADLANRLFGDDRPSLKYNLWIEGLATCQSMRLDEDGLTDDALMSRELAALNTEEVRRIASALQHRLDSTAAEDHRDFFWLSSPRSDLPKRSGYAIGALVADRVIDQIGSRRATALKGPALDKAITDALAFVASPSFNLDWREVCSP